MKQTIAPASIDWAACFQTGHLLALLSALAVLKLIQFLVGRHKRQQTFKRMRIAGPPAHLLSGHLYQTRRQPYVKFAHKLHKQYGSTVGIYLGGDPFLLTTDLELIRQVFVAKSRLFYDRMNFYLNIDPVPDNLICQRGERWRYMRKLLTPAFASARVSSNQFYLDVEQTINKFMRQLDNNTKNCARKSGKEMSNNEVAASSLVEDVYDRMAAVALDVIVKTAFHMDDVIKFDGPLISVGGGAIRGKEVKIGEEDAFLATAKRACKLGFNPLVELIFCLPFLDGPLTFLCNHLYFGAIIKLLFSRLDQLVRRQQKADGPIGTPLVSPPQTAPRRPSAAPRKSRRRIVDSLIEVLRERKITKSEFTGNAFVIVFAGFETTANALTFTLYSLAKDQRVQDKLRAELREKVSSVRQRKDATTARKERSQGEAKDGAIVLEELNELANGCPYLEMVVNESLRLYPPVPGLACRQASVDCTLSNGQYIERGVNVLPSVFTIHRDPNIWGHDAAHFRPERFEMLDISQLNSPMFMPFGLGPRNCIGKALALHELKIVIGRLVMAYSIEQETGHTPEKLRLCSPINITLTNSERIGLNFVKLQQQ